MSFPDARSQESLVMRVFNSDFHPSDDQMLALLKKADLESHGFKKEVITSLKSDPGSNKRQSTRKSSCITRQWTAHGRRKLYKNCKLCCQVNVISYF